MLGIGNCSCGQLNCLLFENIYRLRGRRLFHPEKQRRRIKTGDGCRHRAKRYDDQRSTAIIFFTRELPGSCLWILPYDCIYPGKKSGRGIDVCPGDGFCYTQKNKKISVIRLVRCRPGRVWQSAGWCLRFKPLVLIMAGGSSDRKRRVCHFQKA